MLVRREELSLRPGQQTEFMDLHELVHRLNLQATRSCVLERVGNKGEIIPEFSLEITQFYFTKRGGRYEAWTKSLS